MIYRRAQLLALLFIMVAVGFVSIHLGQDSNWDLCNYHYYDGYAFFHLHLKQDFLAVNIESYFNPYVDAMNYIFITYFPPKLTGFLLGAIQGVNFYLLAVMTNMFVPATHANGRRWWMIAAIVLLGVFSATVIGEIGTTFNDLTIANAIMLALVLIMKAIQIDLAGHKKWLLLLVSGICLGIAPALKLTMSPYAIAAILAVAVINQPWINKLKLMALLATGTLLGFLLLNGHWMYMLWQQFGNPVFPLYNKIFKSTDYYSLNAGSISFLPKSLGQTLFYPFYFSWQRLTAEAPFRDFRLPLAYLLLIIYVGKIIFIKKFAMTDLKKYLLTFFIISYVVWQIMFSVQRYAIILDMLAPLLIYILLAGIFNKSVTVNKLSLLIFIFLVVTLKPTNWGRVPWTESYFNVQIPQEINLQKPGIVFAYYPTGFIRPFFPPDWHFIGLDDNALGWPSFIKKFLQANVAHANDYPWYVLFPGKLDTAMMQRYEFKLAKACLKIKTKSGYFAFCEIQHKSF